MPDLISIIIPVYNVERYLRRCIDTVCNQTYRNLEIILVDDGSTDLSGELCDEMEREDDRIVVIHKENGGLSDARNCGLQHAHGEWIAYVDSDDWISIDMMERLYHLAATHNADVAIGGYREEHEQNPEDRCAEEHVRVIEGNVNIVYELLKHGEGIGTAVWNKLYRREIVEKVPFEFGRIHEDIFFTPKVFYYCNKIVVTNVLMYHYFVARSDSITKKPLGESSLDAIYAFKDVAEFFELNHHDEISLWYWRRYYSMMPWMYCRFRSQENNQMAKLSYHMARETVSNAAICYLKLRDNSRILRLATFLIMPSLYYLLWKRNTISE